MSRDSRAVSLNLAPRQPACVKLTIYSANAVSGNWWDGNYFVDFPDQLKGDRWQISVESFNMNSSNANVTAGFTISCPQLVQGNSYSTLNQSTNQTIFIYNGNSFNRFQDYGTIGIPLRDISFMRGQSLRFYFSTLAGTPLSSLGATAAAAYFGGSTQWCMQLTIYPCPLE